MVSDGLTSIENAFAKVFPGTPHQLCVFHFKKNITSLFPYKLRSQINDELKEVFRLETNTDTPIDGYNRLQIFINNWVSKYPTLKSYRNERNIYYFTYTQFPASIQRMIYSTNWIERLNRDYKRTLKMRGALPSPESVLFLIGSVAMEKTYGCYSYKIPIFCEVEMLKSLYS
jgi:transposase-like protein